MKLQADTINGIYMVAHLDDYNAPPVVTGQYFIDSLPDLADSDELAADLTFHQVRVILRYGYSIHRRGKA